MSSIADQAKALALVVREHVNAAFRPLADRIKALEERAPIKGIDGKDGRDGADGQDGRPGADGKDCDMVAVEALINDRVSAIPTPRDGVDGKSMTADDVRPMVEDLVRAAVDALPAPKDGEAGKDGRDGQDCDMSAVMAHIDDLVKTIPTPKDGRDGAPGKDGADGKSVTLDDVRPIFDAALAQWALDFERRAQDVIARAVDKIPTPNDGKDGRDGVGFDDLTFEQTGDRSAVLRFVRGDVIKEFALKLPAIIDCGVYKDGSQYQRGDAVTWGGSLWIAQADTTSKPDTKDGTWRLAAKRGSDGKAGAQGERGPQGLPGKDGRDLTQLGMDGSKW